MYEQQKNHSQISRLLGLALLGAVGLLVWLGSSGEPTAEASSDTDSTALNSAETQYYLEINSRNSRPDRIEQPAVAEEPGSDRLLPRNEQQVSKTKQRIASQTVRPASADGQRDAQQGFDIDKLAYAVAMAETKNCKLGYGKTHSNCFGIKKGRTVPCKTVGFRRMCVFDTQEESYAAFKIIWGKWYGGFPNRAKAATWTGNDNPNNWLRIVSHYYYQ